MESAFAARGDQIGLTAVYLNAVETCLVAQKSHLAPMFDKILDLRHSKGPRLVESVTSPCNLQLDIGSADGVGI